MESYSETKIVATIKAQNLRFLSLPYDVRHSIYETIFLVDGEIILDKKGIISPSVADNDTNMPVGVRFLRTCKTIYEEALLILYSRNKFLFVGNASNIYDLDNLIRGTPLNLIPYIRFDTGTLQYPLQIQQPSGLPHISRSRWAAVTRLYEDAMQGNALHGFRTLRIHIWHSVFDIGYEVPVGEGDGIESLWSLVTHLCKNLQTIRMDFDSDECRFFLPTIIHLGYLISEGFVGNSPPRLEVKATISEENLSEGTRREVDNSFNRGTHGGFKSPLNAVIEISGSMSMETLQDLERNCQRRGMRFVRDPAIHPERIDYEDIEDGSVVDLSWKQDPWT